MDLVIRRGLDIPAAGRATGPVAALEPPAEVAYQPTEFKGLSVRPEVREGERVARGAVLLSQKGNPQMVLRAPVAGRVREIRRGARRVVTHVILEADGDEDTALPSFDRAQLRGLDRADAVTALLQTGYWPALRTRPLDKVPDPAVIPQSLLIGAMETGPLMPDADVLLSADDAEPLQAAVDLLGRIAPVVHLVSRAGAAHPALDRLEDVQKHTARGPHPAGDMAVQVNLVDPPRGAGQVWTIRAWDAVNIGRTLLSGRFDAGRVIAAVGAGLQKPRFVRTVLGAPIGAVVGAVHEGPKRYVLGSVLTGAAAEAADYTAFLARAVHVLPETVERTLFGWAMPSLSTWSFHHAFLRGLLRSAPEGGVDLRPGLYGGVRAILPLGAYERVIATPDILPEFLFKALAVGDLEDSVRLGMLDLSAEEAALCTYICPSKIDIDGLLAAGLSQYEKEAG